VRRTEDDSGVVDEAFDSLCDRGIRVGAAGERDVEDGVEERLADLGYLR
jgi:hypothetical protein